MLQRMRRLGPSPPASDVIHAICVGWRWGRRGSGGVWGRRQTKLTKGFIPQSDLILFVTSAERPLTETEGRLLEYIRQARGRAPVCSLCARASVPVRTGGREREGGVFARVRLRARAFIHVSARVRLLLADLSKLEAAASGEAPAAACRLGGWAGGRADGRDDA